MQLRICVALLISATLATACGSPSAAQLTSSAKFVRQIEWAGRGTWLKGDTHMHTTFSDGSLSVEQVVDNAAHNGCEAVAITDHGDENLKAATSQYADEIAAARQKHPDMVIMEGLEWNIPPWGGDEHATVLVAPSPNENSVLADFKQRFDDYHRNTHDAALGDEALRWLAANAVVRGIKPVVIYNHPSRLDAHSMENVADVVRWRGVNDLVVGFEGGPGHQRATPLGSYKYAEHLIDRWDPAVSRVGDAWDTLLQQRIDFWGASASSDFHNDNPADLHDFFPCEFSETSFYVPERTGAGVLRALRAGTFFASHGHIVSRAELLLDAPGLPRAATTGEVVQAVAGTKVTARVDLQQPATREGESPARINAVELIAISKDKIWIVASRPPDPGRDAFVESVDVPVGGIVLRARGRRSVPGGPDLMFYTNSIRVLTSSSATRP